MKSNLCQVCDHEVRMLPAANSPIAGYKCESLEESLNQKSFDMNFIFCPHCSMLQYEYFPDADEILDKLYTGHHSTYYLTGQLSHYMNNFVKRLTEKYRVSNSSLVLEIGCNNGRLLSLIKERTGCNVIGVEPSRKFKSHWKQFGITVINDYLSEGILKELKNKKIDLIIIRHVLEHIPDPITFFQMISKLARPNTAVIVEVPYLKTILEKRRIDNTGYSHLNYFSIRSMSEIVRKFEMGIPGYSLEETDGGSILFHIKKGVSTDEKLLDQISIEEISRFIDSIDKTRIRISNQVKKYSASEIVGYGAGAKGSHLIYILGLQEAFNVVVDDTSQYQNMYIPGTGIRIKSPGYLNNDFIKAVINLAPTHYETIRSKVSERLNFIDIFK